MTATPGIGICPATLLVDPMGASDAAVRAGCEAALAAGFTTASVWAQHLDSAAGAGLDVRVVEAATRWANGEAGEAAAEARFLSERAAAHAAGLIGAVCLEPVIGDPGRARDQLAGLVEAAAAAGARVCLEFLPGTGVADLATAWAYVEPLGSGATVLLDTWHWTRQPGGPAFETLAAIPGDRIGYVQLCDAGPDPMDDVMTEAMTARLLPGRGVVDFAAVFAGLGGIGAEPYTATEVFNPGLVQELGAEGAARAMKEAAERVRLGA
jgi:sugar phosphate isomerase/epimerase